MYDVALLIERQLNELDADQIIALHEGLDDTVHYHLLLPVQPSRRCSRPRWARSAARSSR